MSQENLDLVKRGFEHLLATGEPQWDFIAPNLEVHDHHSPDQDVYEGHAGLGRWLGDWDAAWDEWSVDLERFVLRGGKAARLDVYGSTAEALEAVGLPE